MSSQGRPIGLHLEAPAVQRKLCQGVAQKTQPRVILAYGQRSDHRTVSYGLDSLWQRKGWLTAINVGLRH